MRFHVTLGVLAVVAAASTSTVAMAQPWAWRGGYDRGWSDGYVDGADDGYGRGWVDGWQDRDDDLYHARDDRHYDEAPAAYVCKRSSGTAGLIIGGLAGGLLGREVARDRTAGAIVGGGVGALVGRALDRGQSGC